MAQTNPTLPTAGAARGDSEVTLRNAVSSLLTDYNGNVDNTNLAASLAALLGISGASTVRRGKTIIATAEATTSTTFALLTTPDRVSGVVVPADGLLFVAYKAELQYSGGAQPANNGAAIHIGATQLQGDGGGGPIGQAAGLSAGASVYRLLTSTIGGLKAANSAGWAGDVTTGQILGVAATNDANGASGGPTVIFGLPAGTYDVSVRYRADTAATATARNRKLWVWTAGY